jgi:tRNA nucleotidyltransferase (CCA-adding enzyme)
MNALALSKEGQVVDYFGGVSDINQQIIKTVGNPYLRFQEDALRILRALRFSSVLGFKIEENTKKAMLENLNLLDHISKERINTELVKLLLGDYAKEVLSQYQLIFIKIIPLFRNITQEQYSKIYNNMIKLDKDIVMRLSLFLMDFKTDEVVSILKQLKFDNKTIDMVKKINSHLLENITDNKVMIKKLLNIIDYELFTKLLKIKQVIEPGFKYDNIIEILNIIIVNKECYRLKDLMIKGSDLEKLGIVGVQNGVVLNKLLHAVINEECSNVKEELINYANKYLK